MKSADEPRWMIRMRDALRLIGHGTDDDGIDSQHIANRLEELAAQCGFDLKEPEERSRFEEAFAFAEAMFSAGADVRDPSVSKTGNDFRRGLAAVFSRHARR